ncbi:MAG: hypothetical protein ACI87E_005227 [Mariniblastus sp.]|jgi:uncharacterized protein (DUF1499 family)
MAKLLANDQASGEAGSQAKGPARGARRFSRRWFAWRLVFVPLVAAASLMVLSYTASPPDNLGEKNGKLAACPDKPNCVSTQAEDAVHQMSPLEVVDSIESTLEKIKSEIQRAFPRAKLVRETDHYLHYEFRSLVFRFVDDVEFLADDEGWVVHFRSAARVGHSDLGVNRKRMTKISESMKR